MLALAAFAAGLGKVAGPLMNNVRDQVGGPAAPFLSGFVQLGSVLALSCLGLVARLPARGALVALQAAGCAACAVAVLVHGSVAIVGAIVVLGAMAVSTELAQIAHVAPHVGAARNRQVSRVQAWQTCAYVLVLAALSAAGTQTSWRVAFGALGILYLVAVAGQLGSRRVPRAAGACAAGVAVPVREVIKDPALLGAVRMSALGLAGSVPYYVELLALLDDLGVSRLLVGVLMLFGALAWPVQLCWSGVLERWPRVGRMLPALAIAVAWAVLLAAGHWDARLSPAVRVSAVIAGAALVEAGRGALSATVRLDLHGDHVHRSRLAARATVERMAATCTAMALAFTVPVLTAAAGLAVTGAIAAGAGLAAAGFELSRMEVKFPPLAE